MGWPLYGLAPLPLWLGRSLISFVGYRVIVSLRRIIGQVLDKLPIITIAVEEIDSFPVRVMVQRPTPAISRSGPKAFECNQKRTLGIYSIAMVGPSHSMPHGVRQSSRHPYQEDSLAFHSLL